MDKYCIEELIIRCKQVLALEDGEYITFSINMVTLENFKKAISTIQSFNDKSKQLEDLGIDLLESWISDTVFELFDQWVKSNFTEKGIDLVYKWLYEDHKINVLEPELDLLNIDNFYNYLSNNNYTI